ncbi:MAG: tetratricopeptide repeat protein, partial [Pontibacterium sp.]
MSTSDDHVTSGAEQQTEQGYLATLEALCGFEDYFTDEEKSKELVTWIHDETGIPKAGVRLAVKRIAPLLWKVTKKTAGAKLHDFLSRNTQYHRLCEKLLNLLKTKTQRITGTAFDKPTAKNLKALRLDSARWTQLSPEQQGLVQLLVIADGLTQGLQSLQQHLDAIEQQLRFDLALDTPAFKEQATEKAQKGSAEWLTYTHRQAELIGRESDLKALNRFFNDQEMFCWWLLHGAGGVGKSRLALEALFNLQAREKVWELGFLRKSKLQYHDGLDKWRPAQPTVIVIDYVAEHPEQVAEWIDTFSRQQTHYDFPVRLLLVERFYEEQRWWKQLVPASTDGNNRRNSLFYGTPHEVTRLVYTAENNRQKAALKSFLETLSTSAQQAVELPKDEDPFWKKLDELSDKGRPLFIGMVAIAIANGGLGKIRDWNREEVLNYVLEHEKDAWSRHLGELTTQEQDKAYQLLAFCCVAGGIGIGKEGLGEEESEGDSEEFWFDDLLNSGIFGDEDQLEKLFTALHKITNRSDLLIQPDIFAEYFVLSLWGSEAGRLSSPLSRKAKKLLCLAFRLYPSDVEAFIYRSATDFPNQQSVSVWWQSIYNSLLGEHSEQTEQAAKQNQLWELRRRTAWQLLLQGHGQIVLDYWLLPENTHDQLSLSQQADFYNLEGRIYHHRGKYEKALGCYKQALGTYQDQEVGDRAGESTTLNNISGIYNARGEYDQALDYLTQSLAISQEIGDRSGEGTTLNNISQVYKARGEYDQALGYLTQSLAISQEIGDRSGEGTT